MHVIVYSSQRASAGISPPSLSPLSHPSLTPLSLTPLSKRGSKEGGQKGSDVELDNNETEGKEEEEEERVGGGEEVEVVVEEELGRERSRKIERKTSDGRTARNSRKSARC